jgi:hypothetical protein
MTQLFLVALAMAAGPSSPGTKETAVRLYVRPMAAPKPAMTYQLLPDVGELNPGNAAQDYLKCFMEQRIFFYSKQGVAQRTRYQKMTLIELRTEKLQEYGGNALRQADWAARLDTLDWQALRRIRDGGTGVLPPELGPLQLLAEHLQIRFRSEVAGQRFDDAIRTAKTMLTLSRHLGEHPTEVADMVGLWVGHLGLATLEEMVQQPACPNLYWALTDLPCPLVDLRKGVQGERILVVADLRPLRDDAPMTDAELDAFVGRLSGMLNFAREQAGLSPRSVRTRLHARTRDEGRVAAARRRLMDAGRARDLVQKLPPAQVILLDEKRDYEIQRDDRIKLLALPIWEIESVAGCEERASEADGVFADLLPQIVKLRRTQAQLEQQIALLRHVEALRLHAAEHDGKLPARLADVSVPLPVDPANGKPFVYAVEGTTAHIRGGSLRGKEPEPGCGAHYEVILRK